MRRRPDADQPKESDMNDLPTDPIARAAALYVAGRPGLASKGMRFDIVAVRPRALPRHIRDAWRPGD